MKRHLFIALFTLTFLTVFVLSFTNVFKTNAARSSKREAKLSPLVNDYGKIPLSFERNDGQTAAQVKFLSRGTGYALCLTETEAVIRLRNGDCQTNETEKVRKDCRISTFDRHLVYSEIFRRHSSYYLWRIERHSGC
jgi:hypothetical protein